MWSSEPQIVLLAETISTTSYFKLPKKEYQQDILPLLSRSISQVNGASFNLTK